MPALRALGLLNCGYHGLTAAAILMPRLRRSVPPTMTTRKKILIALAVALVPIVLVVGVLGAAVVTSWKAATRAGNEAATTQNLRTIAAVEAQYFNVHNRKYATMDELVREQMLSTKFAAHPPVADGYVITLELTPPTGYRVTADPFDRSSGKRHFYLDSISMQIRVNPDGPAGPNDPLL